jgi:Spy/CpxP family protein refolding chaperone
MKRLMLAWLSLVVGLVAAPVLAQQSAPTAAPTGRGQGQHMDPQEQLQKLTKRLQLTADQQSKIGAILQDRQQQVQSIRGDSSLKPVDKRAKLKSLMESTQSSISAVLTDQQRQRWNDMREKMMEKREAKQGDQTAPTSGQ